MTQEPTQPQISSLVLIPAYNAAVYLPELICRVKQFVCDSNLLVVNDGSTDDTKKILADLQVTNISLPENFGKGAALKAGFRYAIEHEYRSVLTLDADMQHLPEEIPNFFAHDNGQRLLLGARTISLKTMPPHRWLSNTLTSLFISLYGHRRVRDSQCGFRLIPVSLLKRVPLEAEGYDLESELLFKVIKLPIEIQEIPVTTKYGNEKSFIRPVRDTGKFIYHMWKSVWR